MTQPLHTSQLLKRQNPTESLRTTYVTCFHGAHVVCHTQHLHTMHIWLHIELVCTLMCEHKTAAVK
jgi:hypothetical protein